MVKTEGILLVWLLASVLALSLRERELTASRGACNATRVGLRAKHKGLATTKTRGAITEPQEIDLHVREEEIV